MQTSRGPDGGPRLSENSYGLTGPIIHFQNLMTRSRALILRRRVTKPAPGPPETSMSLRGCGCGRPAPDY
jgi:hypothetical protein